MWRTSRHDIIMARHGWNINLGEPVARPVATTCSDLPRRPVWPDKSRYFMHTFCTNKLDVTAGMAICAQFSWDVWIFFRPCRDGRTWSDKHTQFVYIHQGLVWTLFGTRHVATTTSCRTCVVPQLVRPFRMAGIKSVVLCRGLSRHVRHEWAVLYVHAKAHSSNCLPEVTVVCFSSTAAQIPANTTHWSKTGLMLGQHWRRGTRIQPASVSVLYFLGAIT